MSPKRLALAFAAVLLGPTELLAADVEPFFHLATGRVVGLRVTGADRSGTEATWTDASAIQGANAFLATHGSLFGIQSPDADFVTQAVVHDRIGMTHVRAIQVYKSVPVVGGEATVHFDRMGQAVFANVKFAQNISLDTSPALSAGAATAIAQDAWQKRYGAESESPRTRPTLVVLQEGLLDNTNAENTYLVWEVHVSAREVGHGLSEVMYVDAKTGVVRKRLETDYRINRAVYDCNARVPSTGLCYIDDFNPTLSYYFGRSETAPLRGPNPRIGTPYFGSVDVDNLHSMFLAVHNYWLANHGINGANHLGGLGNPPDIPWGETRGFVHFDHVEPFFCPNAAFDGAKGLLLFCLDTLVPDILGHEYAHGVTNFSFRDGTGRGIGLVNQGETGALSEAFSDLFGEVFELAVTATTDWMTGTGSILSPRSLMDPPSLTDVYPFPPFPDRFHHSNYYCGTEDNGGIHHNSTVLGKSMYLMSEGGTFNGCAITGVGRAAAARIWFRTMTTYLTRTATFNEVYTGVNQACADLYTATTCDEVRKAMQAVEIDQPGLCSGQPAHIADCANVSDAPTEGWMNGTSLRGSVPNPTHGAAAIQFRIAAASTVTLEIFDVAGRHVRTVAHEPLVPGLYSRLWDGRDDAGNPIPAGIYLLQLRAGAEQRTQKLVVAR